MGRVTTPKFELQIGKTPDSFLIEGVDSIHEASKEARYYNSKGYENIKLWGNSVSGKRYIQSLTLHPDYLQWNNNKWTKEVIENGK